MATKIFISAGVSILATIAIFFIKSFINISSAQYAAIGIILNLYFLNQMTVTLKSLNNDSKK